MTFRDFAKMNKGKLITATALLGYLTYSVMTNENAPFLYGTVTQKTSIPSGIPEHSQQTHPYWVDVRTPENEMIRLKFDTADIGYDNEKHQHKQGLFVQVGRIGNFESKARELEERIQLGDYLHVTVDKSRGIERNVRDIKSISRK